MRLTLLSFIVCLLVGYELTARPLKENAFYFVIDDDDSFAWMSFDLFHLFYCSLIRFFDG